MRTHRALSSTFATLLLPAALLSVVPAARWCRLDWSQVCSVQFLRCAAGLETTAECGSSDACPLARERQSCTAACATQTPPPPSHHRAYCLGDPAGGRGLRPASPQVQHAPGVLAFVIAAMGSLPPPAARVREHCQLEPRERAPTESQAALPPSRAPPAEC